jgi:hypothetical protein
MKYRIFLIKLDRMLARLESDFGDGSEASTDLEQAIGCAVSGRDAVALDSPKLKSVLQIQPLSKAVSGILLRKEKSK